MTNLTTTAASAARPWEAAHAAARTARDWAEVLDAQHQADNHHPTRDEHWHAAAVNRLAWARATSRYAWLDKPDFAANPTQVVALQRIADAGAGGLYAREVDLMTRAGLMRRGWAANFTRDGRVAGAREWAAHLRITLPGRAVLAAARGTDPQLGHRHATALTLVAATGPAGYTGRWPGDRVSLDVALFYDLARQHNPAPAPDSRDERWTVTDRGQRALARWRGARAPQHPTAAQAALIKDLTAGRTLHRHLPPHLPATYDACERNGWITCGPPDDHGRRPVTLTAAAPPPRTPGPPRPALPRARVGELRPGQTVRLSNRTNIRDLDARWVTVRQVQEVPWQGRQPGGWQVVAHGETTGPYAGDVLFHTHTTFEVKP